jgi:hypothetical protein
MNQFGVGAVGKKIGISNMAPRPSLTPREALELAAWLVATALPLMPGTVGAELVRWHRMLADAGEGTDIEGAALEAIEGIED